MASGFDNDNWYLSQIKSLCCNPLKSQKTKDDASRCWWFNGEGAENKQWLSIMKAM